MNPAATLLVCGAFDRRTGPVDTDSLPPCPPPIAVVLVCAVVFAIYRLFSP